MTKRALRVSTAVVLGALVLACAGLIVVLVESTHASSYGWFAYSPLASESFAFVAGRPPFSAWTLAGAVAVIVGALVAAGWIGYRLGLRRPRAEQ